MNARELDRLSCRFGGPRLALDNKAIDETVVGLYKIGSKGDVFYRKTL